MAARLIAGPAGVFRPPILDIGPLLRRRALESTTLAVRVMDPPTSRNRRRTTRELRSIGARDMAAVDPFVDGGYRAAMEVGGAIGRHRWWADGDVLRIAYHGEVEREHVAALFGVFDEFLAVHGYLLALIDLRDAGGMRPAARRLLGEHRQDRERSSVGFFGVGPVPRLFMGLISSSMRLLGREPLHLCVAGSEASALAWLGRERERHRTTLPVKDDP